MDTTQLLTALAQALSGQGNRESGQGGNHKQGKEPSGIITLSVGENDRVEARYWENPVKDTGLTSIGYIKPRVAETSKGTREFKSFRLTQALADIEATFRVCERALERDRNKLISLTEDDRKAAEQVVSTLSDSFGGAGSGAAGLSGLANGQGDLSSLIQALVARA
jgi:hypothetical protein